MYHSKYGVSMILPVCVYVIATICTRSKMYVWIFVVMVVGEKILSRFILCKLYWWILRQKKQIIVFCYRSDLLYLCIHEVRYIIKCIQKQKSDQILINHFILILLVIFQLVSWVIIGNATIVAYFINPNTISSLIRLK